METSSEKAAVMRIARRLGKNCFAWSVTGGITPAGASLQSKKVLPAGTNDPLAGLQEVLERVDPAIFLFKDFHPYLANPEVVRALRELSAHLRKSPKTLIRGEVPPPEPRTAP